MNVAGDTYTQTPASTAYATTLKYQTVQMSNVAGFNEILAQ